jgi:hypothetical protein
MAQKFKWTVIREHTGDRFYPEGDTRIGTKADLGHLEGKLLELVGADDEDTFGGKGDHDRNGKVGGAAPAVEPAVEKAETEPLNKAEAAAPANKAANSRKSKRK